jgi:tetratricopeptide (TPR) repeat protein
MQKSTYHGGYTAKQVAGMLELSVAQVRAYVRAGFLQPGRGPRRELRFSFQDLVLLKTAKGLLSAEVSSRRVRRALKRLRDTLPNGRPLTGVHITAEANRLIVRDGAARFEPESGQVLLDFGVQTLANQMAPLVRRQVSQAAKEEAASEERYSAEEWFEWGCELELSDVEAAARAYRRVLTLDPEHGDAYVNLGRLTHAGGDPAGAEALYRRALELCPEDVAAAFNLGVALEQLGKDREAVHVYEHAIATDPRCADAHYNLAQLYERLGQEQAAIRHLGAYKRLTRRK